MALVIPQTSQDGVGSKRTKGLQDAGYGLGFLGLDDGMEMAGHQHIGAKGRATVPSVPIQGIQDDARIGWLNEDLPPAQDGGSDIV